MGKEVMPFFVHDRGRIMNVSNGLSPDSLQEHKMLFFTNSNTKQRHTDLRMEEKYHLAFSPNRSTHVCSPFPSGTLLSIPPKTNTPTRG